jgi:hypothetical protein
VDAGSVDPLSYINEALSITVSALYLRTHLSKKI